MSGYLTVCVTVTVFLFIYNCLLNSEISKLSAGQYYLGILFYHIAVDNNKTSAKGRNAD